MFSSPDRHETLLLALTAITALPALSQQTQIVSVDAGGNQTPIGEPSSMSACSEGGRYVAFDSLGSTLVPMDTNGFGDVFVHDRAIGVTTRVSVDSSGAQANADSHRPDISADGRFVAFISRATNLHVDATPSGVFQVFVHDRDFDGNGVFDETGAGARRTVLVSKSSRGVPGDDDSSFCDLTKYTGPCSPSISGDGRYVTFSSKATNLDSSGVGDLNGLQDVFVHDRDTDANGIFDEPNAFQTLRAELSAAGASHPNGNSVGPRLAATATIVVFDTAATDFLPVDANGVLQDVLRWDFVANTYELISRSSGNIQGNLESWSPSVSADGNRVAFLSRSTNLAAGASGVEIYLRDRGSASPTTQLVTKHRSGPLRGSCHL